MDKNIFKIDVKGLALVAPLTVLMIIFNELISFNVYNLKVNISFTLIIIIAGLYGPVYGGLSMLVADLIGTIAFPVAGPFFPGFTISETLNGICYGIFLYRSDIEPPSKAKTILGLLISMLILEYLLNSIFLYMMYGEGGLATLYLRASFLPFRFILGYFTCRVILPKIKKIYLTF